MSTRQAVWLLFVSVWLSAGIIWWSLARSQPSPDSVFAPTPGILAGVAPTSTRPHLLIQSVSGPFATRIQCFSPVDPNMLDQTVTVSVAQDVVPTAHRLCNDPI